MSNRATIQWSSAMSFEASVEGHALALDAAPEHGGQGLGPRPKPLLLVALAGCTGMDVLAILRKMRAEIDGLRISVDGELADAHPKRFESIHLRYEASGSALPPNKLMRAIDLSEQRYCGVRASLHPDIELTREVFLNGAALETPLEQAPQARAAS